MVVLAGEPQAARSLAARFTETGCCGDSLWVGESAPAGMRQLPGKRLTQLLGDECDVLVVDLHGGLSVNVLAATMGVVRGGGLLLWLAPLPSLWPRQLNAGASGLLSHGQSLASFGARLRQRLADIFTTDAAVSVLDMAAQPPSRPVLKSLPAVSVDVDSPCRNAGQRAAVDAVLRVARGHPRRPLVLTADRGRGKSATLGIAAARLMLEQGARIIVTGPGRTAVDVVLRHARAGLPGARAGRASLGYAGAGLRYMPATRLVSEWPDADLVLVDEAAALPVGLLESLAEHYSRIVFSTTVHGYEGSGQGFALRFARTLRQRWPQSRELHLKQPVRWAPDDPVEPLFSRTLLMDAAPAAAEAVQDAGVDAVRVQVFDRDELAGDEDTLRQLYGLLCQAHYQTRPSDLYQLLDAPDVRVLALCRHTHVVAVAVLGLEGGFEASLTAEVHAGRRRPRGHLLAQSLEAHAGLAGACLLRQARVQRIAVHPGLIRRGLGKRLLREAMHEAGRLDCDLIGASFGATPEVLAFWKSCGFHALWLGAGRDAASGAHAVVFARALTAAGRVLVRRGRQHFRRALPHLLRDGHRTLSPPVALTMLSGLEPGAWCRLDHADRQETTRFGLSQAPLAAVLPALYSTAWVVLTETPAASPVLSATQREILLRRLLQVQDETVICRATGLSGRRQLTQTLRSIFLQLADAGSTAGGHDSGCR